MNTIKIIISAMLLNLWIVFPLVASFGSEDFNNPTTKVHSVQDMEDRISTMDMPVDVRFNSKVKQYIDAYIYEYKIGTERLLGRSEVYFPIIDQEIEKRDLPTALKFLAVIESGLHPDVKSKAGAVGMWQFMRKTGQYYGLQVSHMVDQRKDPISSTKAALDYLSDLYNRFGDWTLAIAAYNCGPGNMNKAIRRANSKDYWTLQKYLPRETRNYVPKFIAAAYLMNYYYLHDFSPQQPEHFKSEPAAIRVFEKLSFKELSEITGIDIQHIKELNPGYLKGLVPASSNGMVIVLPVQEMIRLISSVGEEVSYEFGSFGMNEDGSISALENGIQQFESRDQMEVARLPLLQLQIQASDFASIGYNNQGFSLSSMDVYPESIAEQDLDKSIRSRKRRTRF
jgi:hypothetical protein